MPSSSLIFVLVVALWAAYLLQHWIKRREALATARSVDRFSEGMRVLQRRALAQQHVMAMEGIGSDQRRESLTTQPRTSLRAGQVLTGVNLMSDADPIEQQGPSRFAAARAGAAKLGGAARFTGAIRQGGAARLGGLAHRLSGVTARQVRGIALLTSVALLLVTVVLAPFGWAPWWSPIVALLLTAGVVAWLRKAALAAQPAARQPQRIPRDVEPAQRSEHRDRTPTVTVRDSFFDGQAGVEAVTAARPARVSARTSESDEVAEGSWQPVAVPPPTYTLKAKAERPAPEPAVAAYEQTPVDQLPFDGLALDEDLEELPSVYRAG